VKVIAIEIVRIIEVICRGSMASACGGIDTMRVWTQAIPLRATPGRTRLELIMHLARDSRREK